jgi:hypothetical protein
MRLVNLRSDLSLRSQQLAIANGSLHELATGEVPSVMFGQNESGRHGNFHPTSYRNILANPAWARRLTKVHTSSRRVRHRAEWRWRELDCANSSDALLMNIFCYRRTVEHGALRAMLGVSAGLTPEFGFRPGIPLRNGKIDRTEVDMKLGDLVIEAKLTETGFQTARLEKVERYRDFVEVFDPAELRRSGDSMANYQISNYQLIRCVLAAYATGGSFCVLCDARRPDMIEKWLAVMRAVKSYVLRSRLHVLTWQELAGVLPRAMRRFLEVKYGIVAR